MIAILQKLNGWKTYIVCFSTVVYNITMGWNGTIEWPVAIKGSQEALMVAFLRHGISTALK